MNGKYFQIGWAASVLLLFMGGCGQGGSNAGDTYPDVPIAAATVTGPNSFLTYPNPIINASGVSEIDSAAYANAYYAAIDPNNERDTFAKWKTLNGFDSGTGSQITVVVGDPRDLGYGRYITARKNTDGTVAVSVRNYLVSAAAGYGYSSFNLDAAVAQDNRWYIGASNIEFSPGPNGGVPFAKFYFFAPDGSRALAVNLDGRGVKAMPGPCISCHGGRGDPLTAADAAGKQLFPLVHSSASLTRGDVQAHFHPLEPDNFEFSALAGFTRADQEAAIKQINTWVLQSYPLPCVAGGLTCKTVPATTVSLTGFAEDAGRRVASADEWQGAAAAIIKDGYGGNGLPNATYVDAVPADWSGAGQSSLYQNTVVPSCRVCHILRGQGSTDAGTAAGTDIDLSSYTKFNSYADQIKAHTIDRGNMPQAKILYEKFWATSANYEAMASFLEGAGHTVRDASGAVLKPGRPVADAGPSRTVRQGAGTLSGIASMYATSYQWSLVSGPVNGATLSNASARDATFTATADGTYVVQLVVANGGTSSAPSQMTVVVSATAPAALTFTNDILPVLQAANSCAKAGCHNSANLSTAAATPVVYNRIDRNGDGIVNATDDAWMYAEVRGRINFNDPADSALLLKPAGKHHGGNPQAGTYQPGFDSTQIPGVVTGGTGSLGRKNYDIFLNWILGGAPL